MCWYVDIRVFKCVGKRRCTDFERAYGNSLEESADVVYAGYVDPSDFRYFEYALFEHCWLDLVDHCFKVVVGDVVCLLQYLG